MRKAFTLVEMLLVITVAPLMLVVISRIFATFIQDIPRETRVVQQSTTMLDMLGQGSGLAALIGAGCALLWAYLGWQLGQRADNRQQALGVGASAVET